MVKKIPRSKLQPKPPPDPRAELRALKQAFGKIRKTPHVRRWTEEDSERMKELFDQGQGCNAIARELGFHPDTVSQWAKKLGLNWLQKVEEATKLRRARNDENLEALKEEAVTVARKYLSNFTGDDYELVYAGPHKTRTNTVTHAPGYELRDVMTSLRQAVAVARDIEEMERSREQSSSSVDQFLKAMTEDDEDD